MSSSFSDAVRQIPPVTRFFTTSTIIVCVLYGLNLIDVGLLFYQFDYFVVYYRRASALYALSKPGYAWNIACCVLQTYRFFSCFMIPDQIGSLGAIMDIYFFYSFAKNVEVGKFKGRFADCLWFTLLAGFFIIAMSTAVQIFYPVHFSHHSIMLACITYIWSREAKNSVINFMGVIPIKAYYLPLFNLFLKLATEKIPGGISCLIGIIGGYLYQCVQSRTMPVRNLWPGVRRSLAGRRVGTAKQIRNVHEDWIEPTVFDLGYLPAPAWFSRLLGSVRTPESAPAADGEATAEATGRYAFQGKGHRLGK